MKDTQRRSTTFEAEYFEGWYKDFVGTFSRKDLEISKRWFWAWLEKLHTYVPIKHGNGTPLLEIGCSIGAVANLLSERGFEVWASDISAYAVSRARKLTPKVHFLQFDIQKPVPIKKEFGIIIAFEVVEHLEDPEKAMRNMYNALAPGGTLILSTPYPYSWVYSDRTHISIKYPKQWLKIMRTAGLKQIEFHRFTLLC